ncbi:MAG: calcium/sodium antiporter [Verrucomicrobiota bacterium]
MLKLIRYTLEPRVIAYPELSSLILCLLLAVGLAALCFGGDWLARGAGSLALLWKISPVVVGLTIVSIATSMPEMITAIIAAAKGNSGLAVGNIIGSNLGNIGLILGIAALITPIRIQWRLIRQEVPLLLLITLLFSLLCLIGYTYTGALGRIEGILLLAGAVAYLVFLTVQARGTKRAIEEEYEDELANPIQNIWICLGLVLIAGVALWIGAELLVNSSVVLARRMDISDELIGLTIVAIGTSLPELAASVAAALRKQSDIIAGNIVGSNVFNMLLVGGGVAAVYPVQLEGKLFLLEYPAMILLTLLLWVLFFTQRKVSRMEGGLLLVLYGLILTLATINQ